MRQSLQFNLWVVLFSLLAFKANAQEDLFGKTEKKGPRKGWIITLNGNFDIPGGNMAQDFGPSARIGPSVYYKTASNWMFGFKTDFIFGSIIHIDSFLSNVRDRYGTYLTATGTRIGIGLYERGYIMALEAGKIIPLSESHPDNGILFLSSGGFMQYKVDIYDATSQVPQLRGEYLKGYDRLTNGLSVEEYVAYVYFSKRSVFNFHIGLDALCGFTQDRRSYLFDIMRADNTQRIDILFGVRGGIYVPIFKRKSEEVFY
jgi:hypothetical protein